MTPSDQGGRAMSVVVLCRYDGDTLTRTLAGLERQRAPEESAEIVLVDASGNGACPEAAAEPSRYPLTIVRSDRPLTPGAARNLGVRRARGRYVAFLAGDCIPHPDWLARRIRWHQQGYRTVAGAVECAAPKRLAARVQWLTRFSGALPAGRPRHGTKPLFGWSYDRSLLDRPFPEDLPLGEDGGFNARLIRGGERVLFDPGIRIAHIGLTSVRAVLAHQYRHGAATARLRSMQLVTRRLPDRGLALWYPLAKWSRAAIRLAGRKPEELLPFLVVTPWTLAAYAAWARGFIAGSGRDPVSAGS